MKKLKTLLSTVDSNIAVLRSVFTTTVIKEYITQTLYHTVLFIVLSLISYMVFAIDDIYQMIILMIIGISIMNISYTVIFLNKVKIDFHNHYIERLYQRSFMEWDVQKRFTDAISHELATPIAVIRILTRKLEDEITKQNCQLADKFGGVFDCYKECPRRGMTPDIEHIMRMFEGQIDRLDAFITQMRQHKQIKAGNGTQSIMNLIKGTTNCIRLDYIGTTMNITIDDENGDLDKYAVGEGTNNGEVMLVFDNLIKNAHEAKALTMRFQAQANKVKNDNTITLYVGDNGTGIRDRRTGELLINTELIFNPGFSTKENSAKITIVDKILGLERLHKEDTLRGNGLYYSRERLRNAGGDITVFSNSIAGTIFELKIPIKPKRKGP